MDADRTEMHDLASAQPDRVKSISDAWQAWAAKSKVLPLGAWQAKKAPAKES